MKTTTANKITKTLNSFGLYRGFEARRGEVEIFTDNGKGQAKEGVTARTYRRVKAALNAAGLDWSAYRTGYGAWVVSVGAVSASAARSASRSITMDQFGAGY